MNKRVIIPLDCHTAGDEPREILDSADVHGPDYPSETFRVLGNHDIRQFGEYRIRRLVLAAWAAHT